MQLLGGADDGAADGDVVAVVELGGRLDDQVNTVLDRPLVRVRVRFRVRVGVGVGVWVSKCKCGEYAE